MADTILWFIHASSKGRIGYPAESRVHASNQSIGRLSLAELEGHGVGYPNVGSQVGLLRELRGVDIG